MRNRLNKVGADRDMKVKMSIVMFLLFAAPTLAAQDFLFETLTEQSHPLPSNILETLRKSESDAWEDCRQQLKLTPDEMSDYFTAVPIKLSKQQGTLVLPTKYCYAFFGAHSISFWIFLPSGTGPKMVLSGRQDGLRVLDTETHGLASIETFYGATETRFEHNGNNYVDVTQDKNLD